MPLHKQIEMLLTQITLVLLGRYCEMNHEPKLSSKEISQMSKKQKNNRMCMKGETFAMKYNEKSFKLEEITNCNFIFLIGRRHNKKVVEAKHPPCPRYYVPYMFQ